MSEPSSLLKSAAEQRRETIARAIEDVAIGLFAERAMSEVTVEQLVSAAGISLRTFYRYFPTKEHVFMGLPQRGAEELARDMLAAPPSVTPFEAVEDAVRAADRLLDDEDLDRWLAALVRSGATDHLARMALMAATGPVTEALAVRASRPPEDPWVQMAGSATASALSVGIRGWLRAGRGELLTHVLAALDIAGRGLRAGPG